MLPLELGADSVGGTGEEDTTPVFGIITSPQRQPSGLTGVKRDIPSLSGVST